MHAPHYLPQAWPSLIQSPLAHRLSTYAAGLHFRVTLNHAMFLISNSYPDCHLEPSNAVQVTTVCTQLENLCPMCRMLHVGSDSKPSVVLVDKQAAATMVIMVEVTLRL